MNPNSSAQRRTRDNLISGRQRGLDRAPAPATTPPDRGNRLVQLVLEWYAKQARKLPWREAGVGAWPILVSEIMLQQTPVARVKPVYEAWIARWPTPIALAMDSVGSAVRAWGNLGYPRRALRLHESAIAIVERHGGEVPASHHDLLALPGVGPYTAAAVASFAFGERHPVLDTNVRRVLSRVIAGTEQPRGASPSAAERHRAEAIIPSDAAEASRWAAASMELGALVCTTRAPRCDACPVARLCAWRASGQPTADAVPRHQTYFGTDRQARGRLLSMIRDHPQPTTHAELAAAWPFDAGQRQRALAGLVSDGLVEALPDRSYALPGLQPGARRAASGLPSVTAADA
jgi:A/G-specific adenine glycosylase